MICSIVVIAILGFIIFVGCSTLNDSMKAKEKAREDKICSIKNKYNGNKNNFDNNLAGFFLRDYGSYADTYSYLQSQIIQMKETNDSLMKESKNDDCSNEISQCSWLASDFNDFGKKVNQLPYTCMMDASNYGKIQKGYFDSVRSMSKSTVDAFINDCDTNISSKNYMQVFAIDIETVLRCIWFYATDKPYSAESLKKAESVFRRLAEKPHVDVTIAELYAMKQMGGEDVLRDQVRMMLKISHTAEELTLIASALMWINAYQAEHMILQHMLTNGMQMTAKTQERLHSLTNGGGKAPSGFDVSSNGSSMYFDVSALAWKDEEYTGLFENLAFQEKTLSYALAVRDEDKNLFITQGIQVPGTNAILRKLHAVFVEEYGNVVTATLRNCIALSGSGEERIEGILVEASECKQMSILVHMTRIGKKLNIKFYTLFMPGGTGLADQKQQALSLYKKLSPSVAVWESSMKDTILMAIQQLLNSEPQSAFSDNATSTDGDNPIF